MSPLPCIAEHLSVITTDLHMLKHYNHYKHYIKVHVLRGSYKGSYKHI